MTGSNVKVVVNKDTTDRFARNSPTLNHLYKYPVVSRTLNQVVSTPVISQLLSVIVLVVASVRHTLVDSEYSPKFVKIGYNAISGFGLRFDELVNVLFLREGIDAFLRGWDSHSHKPGFWLLFFWVDYVANVSNILLKQFVVQPFKLNVEDKREEDTKSDGTLPHVSELSSTTKSISKDLQSKLQSDYIGPTTDFARQKYDSLVKPTADKLQSEYIEPTRAQLNKVTEPTRAQAMETYKMVSNAYENNFNKSESVPRAVVNTGIDLKNFTIENLRSNKSELERDAQHAKELYENKKETLGQGVDEKLDALGNTLKK
ncbi:Pln1p TDEL_0H01180 [Torulaspora delbrueckii]|uniref:Uncharacterized protein n=1 Tax=Torulaspora delbrueckii TaxID=4950 RepID=G8ZZD3_TORDE|nr:hypothetical protein TDEL_0H01180 [Torulaspora delbrueckii]CCE93977.1 hypothetical protein TDEL_0H01180 [Torulaspora delbrueckii]